MTLQELATIVQEAIPLRVVVINNGYLGMVRQWQELYHGRRYSASELSGPDLPLLAQAYGIPAQVVTTAGELHEALEWADTIAGPSLLDLRVVREENVYPIVPPGAALDELVTEPRHAVRT
jgi:acetolactate synthase-1/2/3 large subunit